MTNIVVLLFGNEEQAMTASKKLTELESHGAISIYEKLIVQKDANDNLVPLQRNTTKGLPVFFGAALGTLIGSMGGPVGLLVGLLSGTLAGTALELNYADFSKDITSKVAAALKPGMVAIIAEMYEQGPMLVDGALEPLGATIFRSNVDYAYEDHLDHRVKEIEETIAAENARIPQAIAAEKAQFRENIDRLKEQRRQRITELKEKQKINFGKFETSMEEGKKSGFITKKQ